MGPKDAILGLSEEFKKDPSTKKVNLIVGAYRDDKGKPFVLESVRRAEAKLLTQNLDHEYAGIAGVQDFVDASLKFGLGEDSAALRENRVAAVQSLSGTGALRVAGEFYKRYAPEAAIYVPNPTWANHIPVFQHSGLETRTYRYYDPATLGLDHAGLMEDVAAAPDRSVFMLHACAHNPTGVDPSMEQWAEISAICKQKNHMVFFDCAYQGFASGDADRDAGAVRMFERDGHEIALSQSFAKNFGLYGERVGAFSVICDDSETADRVLSQLKIIVRPMYSNPPVYGARIVSTILNDPELKALWTTECRGMADRIILMRALLKKTLEDLGSTHDWSHVVNQIGMFCYSGLTTEQVLAIRRDHQVYFTGNGRISMAGVSSGNVGHVAEAIHAVTK